MKESSRTKLAIFNKSQNLFKSTVIGHSLRLGMCKLSNTLGMSIQPNDDVFTVLGILGSMGYENWGIGWNRLE